MAALDEMKVKISADISDLVSKLDKGGISLDQFAKQTTAISSRIGKDVSTGANQAGNALQNLGRVAQDAPFGFIGIQNNINPLIESFQRLKVETGSTKGALSALAGSLVGAGGLGLAVSVATGVLTIMAQNGFFKTEKAADNAKKKIEEFKETVSNIYADAAKETTQVQSLIAVLESETATRRRKLAAIKELQSINPEIFEGLKLEGGLVAGLGNAYKTYLDNIKTVIAVKIKQQQLEEVTKNILEKEGATLSGTAKTLKDIVKNIEDKNIAQSKDNASNQFLSKRLKDNEVLNGLYGEQGRLVKDIGELSAGVDIKTSSFNEKKVKKAKEEVDYRIKLNQLLREGLKYQKDLEAPAIDKPTAPVSPAGGTGATIPRRDFGLEKGLDSREIILEGQRASEATKKLNADLAQTAALGGLISPVFESAFASIANGGNVFSSLGDSLKQLIVQLGQAAIKAAVFSLIFKSIGGGAGGMGSFGSLFGNLLGFKMPGFADGVTGFGGGYAMVGERGPELVRLPQGADVIPNHRLDSVTGGGNQVFIPNMVLRGADLIVQFERAQRQANRRG